MRPVTQGDLLAAARVLVVLPDDRWSDVALALIGKAARADRYRRAYGRAHPFLGNGSLMAAALGEPHGPVPAAGDRRFLAAQAAVIAALLSEGLEGHGGQGAADTGNVEQRF